MRRAAIVSPIRTGVGRYLGALSALGAEELGRLLFATL